MSSDEKSNEPIAINGEVQNKEQLEITDDPTNPNAVIGCLTVLLVVMGIWLGLATGIAYMAMR